MSLTDKRHRHCYFSGCPGEAFREVILEIGNANRWEDSRTTRWVCYAHLCGNKRSELDAELVAILDDMTRRVR